MSPGERYFVLKLVKHAARGEMDAFRNYGLLWADRLHQDGDLGLELRLRAALDGESVGDPIVLMVSTGDLELEAA